MIPAIVAFVVLIATIVLCTMSITWHLRQLRTDLAVERVQRDPSPGAARRATRRLTQ